MSSPVSKSSGTRVTLAVLAFTLVGIAVGCSQAPEGAQSMSGAEPTPAAAADDEQEQSLGMAENHSADFSFDGYALPLPCRRTSDARERTPGGSVRNVIVFACRSHDVQSAASAMKSHMEAHGRSVANQESEGAAQVMLARMPGTANTTIRVSPIADGEADAGSRVRLQWFSKD